LSDVERAFGRCSAISGPRKWFARANRGAVRCACQKPSILFLNIALVTLTESKTMFRQFVRSMMLLVLCFVVSLAYAERREEGNDKSKEEHSSNERSNENKSNENRSNENKSNQNKSNANKSTGKKPPGGNWSDFNSSGNQGKGQTADTHKDAGAEGAAAGHAAENNKNPQASGAQGAAAGAAAANKNDPAHSGAQGAAAGAAAANRNDPEHSGAQGAAAGAAAANRNEPEHSGAQGAAAGAAAANRNNPQYSGAQGAAAGAAMANRNQPAMSGAAGAAAGYASIRNNFDHPGMYGAGWYGDHQGAWAPTGWAAGAAWTPATWAGVAGQMGYGNNTPVSYNYGDNVTCIGGNVVINGQQAGTAEEFSQQADEIAEMGTNAEAAPADQWMPLGVFALVRDESQHPQLIMQLAVNERGILRGNYTDEVTDTTLPIHGAVDQATQRAAWTVGDNKYSVMEAGLNNLTQGEASALMHKNGTTQRWLLVRLEQPSN
jgi:hypothetical protein